MFTGIVETTGTLAAVHPTDAGARLVVEPAWDHRAEPGESISISGCCLTVADLPGPGQLAFDAVHHTLRVTTLGSLEPGDRVNLEHSLRADSLMGGHVVQGHIDGVGEMIGVERDEEWRLRVRCPDQLMPFMIPKGSVAIDGVSLTLAAVDPKASWVEVVLIPTTLEITNLNEAEVGRRCNLETDALARTIVHYLQNWGKEAPGG